MYSVGQVLYTILEKKRVIFPIKVVEEITIKNLKEEKTSYKVLIPNAKQEKVDLDKFKNIFVSLDKASEFMLLKAKEAIDEITFKALSLEESYFKEKDIVRDEMVDDTCNNEIKKIKIDLGNGVEANIDMNNIKNLNIDNETKEEIVEESSNTWWV